MIDAHRLGWELADTLLTAAVAAPELDPLDLLLDEVHGQPLEEAVRLLAMSTHAAVLAHQRTLGKLTARGIDVAPLLPEAAAYRLDILERIDRRTTNNEESA